jgi:hypothetical protein
MAKRLFGERGMVSLNHNFCLSERQIFLRHELDSSGKTGGVLSFAHRVGTQQSLEAAAPKLRIFSGTRRRCSDEEHNFVLAFDSGAC